MKIIQMLLQKLELNARIAQRILRRKYLSYRFRSMGHGCQICSNVIITWPENISIGNQVYINNYVILHASAESSITIGDNVHIAFGAAILTGKLDMADRDRHICASVIIEEGVILGARSIILQGLTIGEGSVVGAGAIVSRDVPPYTLVVGNPARVVKSYKSDKVLAASFYERE